MSTTLIDVRGLARTFKTRGSTVEAVKGVDFTVSAGEIVGFLGPNGAGKTTTQRMLATLLDPTAGEATVAGCDLRKDPVGVRRRIGYVAQGHSTNPRALVEEELVLQARLYGVPPARATERARLLLERFELSDLAQRQNRTLSGGQRRRLDVALGLVHEPQVIFLDEPSTGLDPHTRANLWKHVRALRDDGGAAVFLTTHYLDEADALCDRILVIDHGAIVAEGTPDALKRRISGDLVTFTVGERTEAARSLLAAQPGVRDVVVAGDTVRATVEHGDQDAVPLMRALDAAGLAVGALRIARPSLDDVFLTLTGRSLRDAVDGGQS
jgi:ABC-2 type transport system ATP-binding protein